jgi:hypothetical protein
MSTEARCRCQSCMIRNLMGPAIVITIGVLFLLHQVHGGSLDFGNTWPMILVVMGFLFLVSALASTDGHIGTAPTTAPSTQPVNPAPPAPPQTPYSQGQ